MNLLLGNCLDRLKELRDCSIDSVVTDPPYGMAFMNKKWDYDVPSTEIWKEVLRVLKPGAHLLSFGGTRTYHRMVVNIEDAGFEIRDQIQWIYGSGFPKSLNLKNEWEGWGTALKPANEPICLARKPISEKTIAENVMKWGTGAINIDETRIDGIKPEMKRTKTLVAATAMRGTSTGATSTGRMITEGRWPANLMFDEIAAEMLDEQSISNGIHSAGKKREKKDNFDKSKSMFGMGYSGGSSPRYEESENVGASRFFYVAKASKSERGENNNHPTVKPIKLMQYLVTLITPPQGVVLDPFMGSASTGIAARNLGFDFIGIEKEAEYFEIAKNRLEFHGKL